MLVQLGPRRGVRLRSSMSADLEAVMGRLGADEPSCSKAPFLYALAKKNCFPDPIWSRQFHDHTWTPWGTLFRLPHGNGALQVRRLREARKAAWAVLAAQASDTNVHNTRLQEGSATDDTQALRQARRRPPLHSTWLRPQQAVPQPVLPLSPNRRGDPARRPRQHPSTPCCLRSCKSRPPRGCPGP